MSDGNSGIPGKIHREIKPMWFTNKTLAGVAILTGSNYLEDGYSVCLDPVNTAHTDGTGTARKGYCVTQPETRNLMMYAGVVTNVPPNFQGPGWVDVIVKTSGDVPARVKANLSTATTTSVILTPANGLWTLAAIADMDDTAAGNVLVRASVAVASTTGTAGTAGDTSGVTGGANENICILPTCAI